jgi:hypothetical protein
MSPWRAVWRGMGRWRWLWIALILLSALLTPLEMMK